MRLLVVSHYGLLREALAAVLARELEIPCPGQAQSASQALKMCQAQAWDVVLIAANPLDGAALYLACALKRAFPGMSVIRIGMPPAGGRSPQRTHPAFSLTCDCSVDELMFVIQAAVARHADERRA
jgi:DNA-binding NarL/FixJ family response regulator